MNIFLSLDKSMNSSFSFTDEAIYYEEDPSTQGNWDFTSATKADNRKVNTSLKSKVDKVKKEKEIVLSDPEEDEDEEDEEEEEEEGRSEEGQIKGSTDEVIVEDEMEMENEEDDEEGRRAAEYFEEETEEAKSSVPTFHALHLSRPLLRAVTEMGFVTPTPIQYRCIPKVLAGRDLCAGAQTGSGKTAAFLLPTLERLLFRSKKITASRVLVITPTRELATQCHQMCSKLMQYTDVSAALVVGGLSIKQQEVELRNKPDIIICTPGKK